MWRQSFLFDRRWNLEGLKTQSKIENLLDQSGRESCLCWVCPNLTLSFVTHPLTLTLTWAFHPRDTQAYWSSFKYFWQTRQHLEADRIEFTDKDTALQCPCLLRTVITWLWDMDSPEGWWTAIRSVPHELPTTDLRNPLVPFCHERLSH